MTVAQILRHATPCPGFTGVCLYFSKNALISSHRDCRVLRTAETPLPVTTTTRKAAPMLDRSFLNVRFFPNSAATPAPSSPKKLFDGCAFSSSRILTGAKLIWWQASISSGLQSNNGFRRYRLHPIDCSNIPQINLRFLRFLGVHFVHPKKDFSKGIALLL